MHIGLVGLGRMGANMAERLRRHGHEVETYARTDPARTVTSLEELVAKLEPPRVAWMMVPAGDATEQSYEALLGLLEPGDVLVDGGNSNFRDSQRRAAGAKEKGIRYLDAGVSGGIWGLEGGYCVMVGGEPDAFAVIEPLCRDLTDPGGYAHVGRARAPATSRRWSTTASSTG